MAEEPKILPFTLQELEEQCRIFMTKHIEPIIGTKSSSLIHQEVFNKKTGIRNSKNKESFENRLQKFPQHDHQTTTKILLKFKPFFDHIFNRLKDIIGIEGSIQTWSSFYLKDSETIISKKNLMKFLCTEDNWEKLEDLNHFTPVGKFIAYSILHLFLNGKDSESKKKTNLTFKELEKNSNINVVRSSFFKLLEQYSKEGKENVNPVQPLLISKNEITKAIIERCEKQCGRHNVNWMAARLNVWNNKLGEKLTKNGIEKKDPIDGVTCEFCSKPQVKTPKIKPAAIAPNLFVRVVESCGQHKATEMAKILNVSPTTLSTWMKNKISSYPFFGPCEFCFKDDKNVKKDENFKVTRAIQSEISSALQNDTMAYLQNQKYNFVKTNTITTNVFNIKALNLLKTNRAFPADVDKIINPSDKDYFGDLLNKILNIIDKHENESKPKKDIRNSIDVIHKSKSTTDALLKCSICYEIVEDLPKHNQEAHPKPAILDLPLIPTENDKNLANQGKSNEKTNQNSRTPSRSIVNKFRKIVFNTPKSTKSDETESNTKNSPILNPLPQTPKTPATKKGKY